MAGQGFEPFPNTLRQPRHRWVREWDNLAVQGPGGCISNGGTSINMRCVIQNEIVTGGPASSAALVEAPTAIRCFPGHVCNARLGVSVFTSQPGRSRGQSEHAGGFWDTATPQIGLEAITSVLAGWECFSESGQLGR
jgi:hypothetical protein